MDANKWGIVYCPKSGSFRPQKRWERIEKILNLYNIDYDFVQSEQSSSVDRLVTMLINNGYKTIIVVGGDSALNDAVNCLMSADKKTRVPAYSCEILRDALIAGARYHPAWTRGSPGTGGRL